MVPTGIIRLITKFGTTIQNSFLANFALPALSDLQGLHSSISYGELLSLSNKLARALNQKAKPNDRTVVLTGRSPLGIAGIVGTFLSETVYVPIDSQDPLERVKFILEDSRANQLIVDDETSPLLSKLNIQNIEVHNLNSLLKRFKEEEADYSIGIETEKTDSYMIYTSGTTGKPKGVLVGEGTLSPLLKWVEKNTLVQECEKTLQFYSLGFDPSLLEIFSTLLNGKELVVTDHETKKDLNQLVSKISERKIERLFLPISLVQLISEEFEKDVFSSIKEISCGGDRMVITSSIRKFLEDGKIELNNQYGPTEATIMVTNQKLKGDPKLWPTNPSIGKAISRTHLYVLDENLMEVPAGEKGVLFIGGDLLAKGYWNNKELTEKSFITHERLGTRLYRTGDLASIDEQGFVTFLGREDHQIKINGLRVECSEIENLIKEELLSQNKQCDEAVVILCERKLPNGQVQKFLGAAVKTNHELESAELKTNLATKLPSGMVPTLFIRVEELPLTSNGKIDRDSIQKELGSSLSTESPKNNNLGSEIIKEMVQVLEDICGLQIDPAQSVFEQSLTSLQAIKFVHRTNKLLKDSGKSVSLNIADLYQKPILNELEKLLCEESNSVSLVDKKPIRKARKVAIVGMSCRFPMAESISKFEEMIEGNKQGIQFFDNSELTHPSQEKIKDLPNFVSARGILQDIDLFDAQNFGIPPRVAEVMDPQMRLFLEESLKAIENTIYLNKENTGVYCGMSNNTYIDQVEALNSEKCDHVGRWNLATLNEKDYIATQVAHKLNLKGPALSIHTACSTSLVAMVQAVRAIQNGECESALCGGVHIDSRHKTGHLHQEGSIFSKDGACRPYDQDASGTIFSDGIGVVVLKDFDQALKDGNQILGIVAGCGLNNDGADKTSFTAPSVKGQRDAILMAMLEAGISPDDLSFIEGHGTATPVGDPIEVQALMEAFKALGSPQTQIGLTSVKAQIGHTVAASGIAGVIKATLCLKKGVVPAIANFVEANPLLQVESTPFTLQGESHKQISDLKKYCGISSFGVGGTNAHVILERVQSVESKVEKSPSAFVIPLSAKSSRRLKVTIENLLKFLRTETVELGSLAKALAHKEDLSFRKAYVCKSQEELINALQKDLLQFEEVQKANNYDQIVFGVPGQGTQYSFMGQNLYADFDSFRSTVDLCCEVYEREFGTDLKDILFHNGSGLINFTQYTQPALFVYQLGMMNLLASIGIMPDFLIGHSVGEFAIAAFNGLLSVEDAMILIGKRGNLMATLPAGLMLSVRENAKKVEEYIKEFRKSHSGILSIATINTENLCVVGGESKLVKDFSLFLEKKGLPSKELKTSHAFHTAMMDSILDSFSKGLNGIEFKSGKAVQVSTSDQDLDLSSPEYWTNHITKAVNFQQGSQLLGSQFREDKRTLTLDVGPRLIVGQLLKQNLVSHNLEIQSVNKGNAQNESIDLLVSLARAWEKGASLNFKNLYTTFSWCDTPEVALIRNSYWAGYPLKKSVKNELINNKTTLNFKEDTMQNFKNTLKAFIEDKSGFSDLGMDSSFLELGLDSLLLTQLAIDIKNEYSVEVSFRDLMDSIDSIDKLSNYLTEKNSDLLKVAPKMEEATPVETVTQAQQPVQQPIHQAYVQVPQQRVQTAMSSDLGSIIQGQMDLMRMQLEILAGGAVTQTIQAPQTQQVATPQEAPAVKAEVKPEVKPVAGATEEEEIVKGTVNTSKIGFGAQARVNTIKEETEQTIKENVQKVIETYCKKTPKSKTYTEKYRKVNADPRVVTGFRPEIKEITYPLVVNKSKNQRLWDLDGNEYVDVTCGFGSNFFGNQNERITKALHDQLDKGFEIGPQHELAGECAELLCELTGNERSAFCNTGSEAVLGALRVSRTITGRQKIVMFKGSYHGINDEVIVRGRGDGKAMPAAAGINPSATKDMILLDYGTDEALKYIRENAKELAAVIVEPVQSRRSNFQPKEFLQEIRKITEASGTAFIFDEVITGFRIALGGAQEYFGIRADLVTYGKIIGGGMPIGIVSGKAKFMDALDGGPWQFGDDSVPTTAITYFAGTFVRHPLALRALKEALLILKEGGKDLYFNINQKAQKFVDQINLFSEVFGAPIVVDNFGGVLKPRFTDSGKNNDIFFALMRIAGVHCYDGFPWFVTLGHQEGDLEFVQDAWKKCIIEMQTLGLFPKGLIAPESGLGGGEFIIPPQSGSVLVKNEEGKPSWKVENESSNKII